MPLKKKKGGGFPRCDGESEAGRRVYHLSREEKKRRLKRIRLIREKKKRGGEKKKNLIRLILHTSGKGPRRPGRRRKKKKPSVGIKPWRRGKKEASIDQSCVEKGVFAPVLT